MHDAARPQVMAAVVQVHQDISKAANRLKRHTDGWKKYSDIWKSDRVSLLDKFKAKAPPTPAFEEKFSKFQKVRGGCLHRRLLLERPCKLWHSRILLGPSKLHADNMTPVVLLQQAAFFWGMAHDLDIGCVRVGNASLAMAVHEECCAWTRALAAAMRELDVAAVTSLRDSIAAKHVVLQQQPEDLEELKAVLHVINAIRYAADIHARL